MQKTKELRYAEVRPSGVEPMVLVGRPVVYDEPTTIAYDGGTYTEVIHRGALDHCDLSDTTLTVNHDDKRIPLARAGRTMTLEVTEKGLYMRAELSEGSQAAKEVYEAVRRGDMTGMSFAFTVPEGGSAYDSATNTRHITAISKVYETSIVTHPAYPQASVEARDAIAAARDADRARAAARASRLATRLAALSIINH